MRSLGTGGAQAAAGDDSRFPSTAEKSALAGTSGVPGAANKYLTDADPRNTNTRTPTDGSVTAAKFASLPHGKMRQTGTCQSLTSGTFQAVRFDSLQFGNGVTFDDTNDSLVVGTAGTYMITGEINWALNQTGGNTGTRALEVYAGGNEVAFDGREAATATNTGQNAMAIVSLPANAAVRAEGGQASGSTLALANPFGRCASLAVQWIGP